MPLHSLKSLCWCFIVGAAAVTIVTHPAHAQPVVVGPGPVAPMEINGSSRDYQFLSGTEIVSHEVTSSMAQNGPVQRGGPAVMAYSPRTLTFEGGRYEGASFIADPGTYTASGGNALNTYTSSKPTIRINDGLFRGGSVFANTSLQASLAFGAQHAIILYPRYGSRLSVYGGVIEGGTVALASAPDTPLERGYAIYTSGYGDVNRHLIEVHGGTFIGGIRLTGIPRLTVYGSELDVQPDLDGLFTADTHFTLTGRYADGTLFSHSIQAHPSRHGHISRGPNSLTIELLAPEPSGVALVIVPCALLGARRARRISPLVAAATEG